jgi:hypothetical protein
MATELSDGNWVGISIVSGIVIASLIGGIGTAIQNSTRTPAPPYSAPVVTPDPPDNGPSELAQGDPGSPLAVLPLNCAAACFGETEVAAAMLSAHDFGAAEVPFTHPVAGGTTALDAQPLEWETWDDSGISPGQCFVTWSTLPIVEGDGIPVASDYVAPMTEQAGDGDTLLTQSVRLFADTDSAESYMAALYAGLAACPDWKTVGNGVERPVYLAPSLRTPDSVASFGFVVEPQKEDRRFVFDLQRGNMVIRSVLVTDDRYGDQLFRTLMREQADAMAALVPVS